MINLKNKHIIIVLIGSLVLLGIVVTHYLTKDYAINFIPKNNIEVSAQVESEDELLLPIGYLEYDESREYWGYINQAGKIVIELKYEYTYDFDENNLAVVMKNNKYGLINKMGEEIFPVKYQNIDYKGQGNYFVGVSDEKYLATYQNAQINLNNPVEYNDMGYFFNDLAYVIKDDKLGYIKADGSIKIDFKFEVTKDNFSYDFVNNYAFVFKDNKYGIIDDTGSFVLEPSLDEVANNFDEFQFYLHEYIPYRVNDKWGYIGIDGEILIEPQYLDAYHFTIDDLAVVSLEEGTYQFIRKDGKLLTENSYLDVSDFINGYAVISKGEHQIGIIDILGGEVIKTEYDYISLMDNEYVLLIKDRKTVYKNMNDGKIIEIDYKYGDEFTNNKVIFASNEFDENRFLVILNQEGERIYSEIEVISYNELSYNSDNYIRLVAYEKASNLEYYTYLDQNGNLLWKVYK